MTNGNLVININVPIERSSLVSEIRALPRITAMPKKKKEPVEEREPMMLSSIPKKGKSKDKKKKKSEDLDFMSSGRFTNEADEDGDFEDDKYSQIMATDNLIDVDDILYRDGEDDDMSHSIIDEQRRGYEKRKKDENPFKKEFAEELTLLYDLLDEMDKLSKELDKKYKQLEGSKVRGASKYTNDHVINMLSAKSHKLAVLKEINSLKKTIADLKIKVDAKNKEASSAQQSTDATATKYFQHMLKYGRNNFVSEFGGNGMESGEPIDDLVARIESSKFDYSEDEEDTMQQLIDDRLDSEDNPFRTANGSKQIEYETLGVKIFIKKCIDTNEWEFVALDRDNQQIFDYPIPTKKTAGKIKFSDDYATDALGRSYKVIEYYLPEDEY